MSKQQFSRHDNRYLIVGKILKRHRTNNGFTMRSLAEKMKLPHSFIGKVENAERRLDTIEIFDYCNALGVSATSVLKEINAAITKPTPEDVASTDSDSAGSEAA